MEITATQQVMVDEYLKEVNKIAELDEKLGNTTSSGRVILNSVVKENPTFVAEAQRIAQVITLEEDPTKQVVMAQTFLRDVAKVASEIVDAFVKANSPEPTEDAKVTEEMKAAIYEQRSDAQKLAKQLYQVLALMQIPMDGIPDCPEGIRGAHGKRDLGRKLDPYFITVEGEELGVLTAAKAAKAAGCKRSELQKAVEAKYPEGTPDHWIVEVNKKVISGVKPETAPVSVFQETDESTEVL